MRCAPARGCTGEIQPPAPSGRRPGSGSALSVEGAEVSAVRRSGDALEVRVFNPTDRETTVTLAGHSGWLVDLRGRPLEPFAESFPLRPHGIATLVLDAAPR